MNRTSGKLTGGAVCSTNAPLGLMTNALPSGTLSLSQLPNKEPNTSKIAKTKTLFKTKFRSLVILCPVRVKKLGLSAAAASFMGKPLKGKGWLVPCRVQRMAQSVHLRPYVYIKFENQCDRDHGAKRQ